MLVLSRGRNSVIQIGTDVKITVLEIHKGRVKLGIHAPNDIPVQRQECLLHASCSQDDAPAVLYERRRLPRPA